MKKLIILMLITLVSVSSCKKDSPQEDTRRNKDTYSIRIFAPKEETGKINYSVKLQKRTSVGQAEDVKLITSGQYDQKVSGKLMDDIVVKDVPKDHFLYVSASWNREYITIVVKKNNEEIFNKTEQDIVFSEQNK